MSAVKCPQCGENGNVPDQMIGRKIRCHKCQASFVAGAVPSSQAISTALTPVEGTIEIEGLDPASWALPPVAVTVEPTQYEAAGGPSRSASREYKVLTSKDRWYGGKFEITRLEDCLNHYASQGWSVRGMATPHVTGFSGGPREELVILMER